MSAQRSQFAAARLAITQRCRTPEAQCLPPLIEAATLPPALQLHADTLAAALVEGLRARGRESGLEALMRQLPLSGSAGAALLSLAESLLRVPDGRNADRLLRDKLGRLDSQTLTGRGALARALALAVTVLRGGDTGGEGAPKAVATAAICRAIAAVSAPLVRGGARFAIGRLSAQFIFSQTIERALVRARRQERAGYCHSFDMLGEAALTATDAQRYSRAYESAIHCVGQAYGGCGPELGPGISVKLSALHPRYGYTQTARVMDELLPRLRRLALLAKRYDMGFCIDAEETDRLELSLDLLEALALDRDLDGWNGLGFAVQAYQKRAPAVIDYALLLARQRSRRLMIRLVKGAYWDSEIKRAQLDGLDGYPVYTRKCYTDVAYLACARQLLMQREWLLPQFATHNAQTVAAIITMGGTVFRRGDYEFQRLFGMGARLYAQIVHHAEYPRPCRIYAPVGARHSLLAYLMRRLLENGAATSFVRRAADASLPRSELIAHPVATARRHGGRPHPHIALPVDLFTPERRNSRGIDLADEAARGRLLQRLAAHPVTSGGGPPGADAAQIDAALVTARIAAPQWAATAIVQRAAALETASAAIEQNRSVLCAFAIREAGKTLPAAIGEVREAVDYLRYYAAQIRREFDFATHRPLGVVVCISPWNFPLAIFVGQVAAALAAGNAVIAKPAEQTPQIARVAVRLLHAAGIPQDALQLVPGSGDTVGATLVADSRVDAVIFTGSIGAAKSIGRALAARADVPLIAETGGQNAMIVDSTALPEQVVSDVLSSAFDSAGQRCSALRVLCLQAEIADDMSAMLIGAMRELRVGDPADIATDSGPLVDAAAKQRVEAHIDAMRSAGRRIFQTPLPAACRTGNFVPPTLIEIESMADLQHEVFGPVLHLLRFDRERLSGLVDAINATGYGLTLGIHSRIEATANYIIERARVGNIYVNRNMIGAVVGVQPFGGYGLSGTGPKAGGPLYLHRLLRRTPGPQILRSQRAGRLPETRLLLRGPVGERNELMFRPRGRVLGTGRSPAALTRQREAAEATGNRFISYGGRDDDAASCDVVLVDAHEASAFPDWAAQLRRQFAAQEGAIVPVVQSHPDYPPEQLMAEQALSVNTAAVGGNVSLLALGEDEEQEEVRSNL